MHLRSLGSSVLRRLCDPRIVQCQKAGAGRLAFTCETAHFMDLERNDGFGDPRALESHFSLASCERSNDER